MRALISMLTKPVVVKSRSILIRKLQTGKQFSSHVKMFREVRSNLDTVERAEGIP